MRISDWSSDVCSSDLGHCFRNQVVNLCRQNSSKKQEGNLTYQNGSMEFLARLADMTGKMTLLPEMATYAWPEERKQAIRPFEGRAPVREISLIYQRDRKRDV